MDDNAFGFAKDSQNMDVICKLGDSVKRKKKDKATIIKIIKIVNVYSYL